MNKPTLALAVSLGLGAAITTPSAQASGLYGACYDYASKTSSTSTSVDYQAASTTLVRSLVGLALGSSSDLSALATLYPILYFTITSGIAEKSVTGADPELVACLAQFESRLSSLEVDQLTDDMYALETIIHDVQRNVSSGLDYYQFEAAERYADLANELAYKIQDRFADMENGHGSVAVFDTLANTTIPGFVAAMQMAFLHRAEFDHYCQNLAEPPYWNGVDNDALPAYTTLFDVYDYNIDIESVLTRPETAKTYDYNCSLGYGTFFDFMNVKQGLWGETLRQIGLEVVANGRNAHLISVNVDFANSKLMDYRASFIGQCSGETYTDEYSGYTSYPSSMCATWRDNRVAEVYNASLVDPDSKIPDVKATLYDLAHVLDAWDLTNLIKTRNEHLDSVGAIDFHNALRLRHSERNRCMNAAGQVTDYCKTNANHFVFEPYSDGYSIMRAEDARYLKDKGEDDTGFVIRSVRGTDSTWYLDGPNTLGAYQIRNKHTQLCLQADDSDAVMTTTCSWDTYTWNIDGSHVPTDDRLVRFKNVQTQTCLSQACSANAYEFVLTELADGYEIKRWTDAAYLKHQNSGIVFSTTTYYYNDAPRAGGTISINGDSVWYVLDTNGDGYFALRNQSTGQCMVSGSSAQACGDSAATEVWALEYQTPPVGQNLALEDDGRCLAKKYNVAGSPDGYAVGMCSLSKQHLSLESHNDGYLLMDTGNRTYLADEGANEYDFAAMATVSTASDSATWDFLGPYDNDKFQIRNRSTGKCLKSMQANQWNSYRAVVINCSDESSKAWTFSTP
ncbi:RICIN domain-containing protein [Vibrio coralliilyticus]|uniref:Ricin B lectin domain-containing protein n=1 Tax=Vibrio coralliilyticus TaxID=190893 RepID=A0AAN0W0D3_9VIBR|nr:RICIN domain-containing protein [Vibrio coralliilyticus]AIW22758.1 hypothetical protein IX92_27270 [Vibrio coralliilyticus]NOH38217.1 RICIN domain-containing protein [Vibrio coralliilyticus]NOH55070.1 RICIN domain-containing protein [Vibrio coralliilyticus]